MKRLHIHISVENLNENRRFYTALFGQEPTTVKADYLQWLVDEPAVNFALSAGRAKKGLNHLGLQVDSDEALEAIEARFNAAGVTGEKQEEAQCCYARSNKYWAEDPQGVIWEQYRTMEQVELFGGDAFTGGTGCCEPAFSANGTWRTGGC
jgi:catechol 2,3-dioxygenase-like lactoylglutathione lyase family enzyme